MRNSIMALLDLPFSTLADVLRLFNDRPFRRQAIPYIANRQVRTFWQQEYEGYTARLRAEAIAPIQNKVGAFLTDPRLRSILVQPHSSFDLRQIMDQRKILLVNLSKGLIGQDTSSLLGALLVSHLGLVGLSRADTPDTDRADFYVYLDEFQNFATNSLAGMLSELRKYWVNLILAHQYLSQLDIQLRDAILGNVGTLISFRVGPIDAEILGREFEPTFTTQDLANLPNYHIFLKLMVGGVVSDPFSGVSMQCRSHENAELL